MKKALQILLSILGVFSLFLIFVGFYEALFYFQKDWTLFSIFLVMHVAGWVGMSIVALSIIIKKKKHPEEKGKPHGSIHF